MRRDARVAVVALDRVLARVAVAAVDLHARSTAHRQLRREQLGHARLARRAFRHRRAAARRAASSSQRRRARCGSRRSTNRVFWKSPSGGRRHGARRRRRRRRPAPPRRCRSRAPRCRRGRRRAPTARCRSPRRDGPTRLSAGTRQSSKCSATVPEARWPILSSSLPITRPGVPRATTKPLMPSGAGGRRCARTQVDAGVRAARDPHLLAVEHPLVAVEPRGRGQRRGVGAAARLAERRSSPARARPRRRGAASAPSARASRGRPGSSSEVARREHHRGRRARLRDRLHREHVADVVAPAPPSSAGHLHREQPELGELAHVLERKPPVRSRSAAPGARRRMAKSRAASATTLCSSVSGNMRRASRLAVSDMRPSVPSWPTATDKTTRAQRDRCPVISRTAPTRRDRCPVISHDASCRSNPRSASPASAATTTCR